MTRFFSMMKQDASHIALEHWTNTLSVEPHAHTFDELLLVDFGTCRHMYRQTETMLIPGDAVLVRHGEPHGLSLTGKVSVYNAQFSPKDLSADIQHLLVNILDEADLPFSSLASVGVPPSPQLEVVQREDYYKQNIDWGESYTLNTNRQGVAHLSPAARTLTATLMKHGLEAQEDGSEVALAIKRRCLELIVLEIVRAIDSTQQKFAVYSHAHQEIVSKALRYIEEHLQDKLDFNAFAHEHAFSIGYFRRIFKDATGFSPLVYTNRLRMAKAAALLQNDAPVNQAAEAVGIYDLNYFSRLFKKIMGVTPSTMRK